MTVNFSCKCYQMTRDAELPVDFSFPKSPEFLKLPKDLRNPMTHKYFTHQNQFEWPKTPNDQITTHFPFKCYQMTSNTKLPYDVSFKDVYNKVT